MSLELDLLRVINNRYKYTVYYYMCPVGGLFMARIFHDGWVQLRFFERPSCTRGLRRPEERLTTSKGDPFLSSIKVNTPKAGEKDGLTLFGDQGTVLEVEVGQRWELLQDFAVVGAHSFTVYNNPISKCEHLQKRESVWTLVYLRWYM